MQSTFKKKDFIGLETCFGIPLGNSVSRTVTRLSDQIKEFTIVSVGTKTIKHSQSVKLSIDGSTCTNNFGYQAFPTRKDAEEFLHKHQMITNIKNNLDFSKLSYQEVLDLHKKEKQMKFTIFAHSHCTDGLVAASIMKYSLQMQHNVEPEVIFVSYGKEQEAIDKANIDSNTTVYCVDFAFNKELTLELCKFAYKVYVLDHHKTAYENLEDLIKTIYNFYFTYDVNKSGASIVRDFCKQHLSLYSHIKLNQKEILNKVVNMVEDRDLWLFKLPMTKEFAEYIFAYMQPNDIDKMSIILFKYSFDNLKEICKLGETIMNYKNNIIENKIKSYIPVYFHVDNTKLLIINETQQDLVSQLGNELCKKYNIPVCLYNISGSEYSTEIKVNLSFRSMDNLEPVDVVARLFSGGGHKNSSGGECSLNRFTDLLHYK